MEEQIVHTTWTSWNTISMLLNSSAVLAMVGGFVKHATNSQKHKEDTITMAEVAAFCASVRDDERKSGDERLRKMEEAIARMDERIHFIAKRNGYNGK